MSLGCRGYVNGEMLKLAVAGAFSQSALLLSWSSSITGHQRDKELFTIWMFVLLCFFSMHLSKKINTQHRFPLVKSGAI